MIWRISASRRFAPPTDVVELPDKIVVVAEIAGMQPDDFNITLLNRTLLISGVRPRSLREFSAYHQLEIGFGEFRIEITLPWAADQEGVTASYREGFLQIELPRRREVQVPVVDVSTETEQGIEDGRHL